MNLSPFWEKCKLSGSPVSDEEGSFLEDVVEAIDRAKSSKVSFVEIGRAICADVDAFSRDVVDHSPGVLKDLLGSRVLELAGSESHAEMTEGEEGFLEDLKGFIDFGVRNGIPFRHIIGGMAHDLHEFERDDFDFEKARKRFSPRLKGYAQYSPEALVSGDEDY
ncbi:MAG: hypothetical protein WCL32_05365 [Planctomycetota bacterium]|jgi:hypothetical protein